MALWGQLLSIENRGSFIFHIRLAINDSPEEGGGTTNPSKHEEIYDVTVDFTDREKPITVSIGPLDACMKIYEKYSDPEMLEEEDARKWKVAYIADTIVGESLASDLFEIIRGDDYMEDFLGINEDDILLDSDIPNDLDLDLENDLDLNDSDDEDLDITPEEQAELEQLALDFKNESLINKETAKNPNLEVCPDCGGDSASFTTDKGEKVFRCETCGRHFKKEE